MRQTLLAALLLSFAVMLPAHRPAFADAKDEARLRNQVKDLQQDVARLKREVSARDQLINKLRKDNLEDQMMVKALRDKDQLIAKLQADAQSATTSLNTYVNTRAVYTAFYKPRPSAPANAATAFISEANTTLSKVGGVRGLWVGRANGDSDFQVALVAVFDDATALKKFRDDAAVQRFDAKYAKDWEQSVREIVRGK